MAAYHSLFKVAFQIINYFTSSIELIISYPMKATRGAESLLVGGAAAYIARIKRERDLLLRSALRCHAFGVRLATGLQLFDRAHSLDIS